MGSELENSLAHLMVQESVRTRVSEKLLAHLMVQESGTLWVLRVGKQKCRQELFLIP